MNKLISLLSLSITLLLFGCNKEVVVIEILSQSLEDWLEKPLEKREALESLAFAAEPLSQAQTEAALALLFKDKQAILKAEYGEQWDNRILTQEGYSMPFHYQTFGAKPSDGRSLFISLHGGGGAPSNVNDQQYDNQKRLYDQVMNNLEGIYLAPRAPTNTWDLWHQNHIDDLLDLIIELAVLKEEVNPDKVYLLGYSAGGDGVYQLAPRMADRWAAAAMMAGHPNDANPLGLSNTPFTIHMGALDDAYNRNEKAQEWKDLLTDLESNAPGRYIHEVQIHEGLGHWMNLEDAVALPWMKNYQRQPTPEKVVWKQDDRHHKFFYWIGVPEDLIETGGEIIAEYNTPLNEINILTNYSNILQLYLNDEMLDLDQPVIIKYQGNVIHQGVFKRSILNLYETLLNKGDRSLSFPCIISVLNNTSVQE